LAIRRLDLGIVGQDFPATEGLVLAGLAVDLDAHLRVLGEPLLGGVGQSRLQGAEHHFRFHILLTRQGVSQHQHFPTHRILRV
jgi:hypothetical protein